MKVSMRKLFSWKSASFVPATVLTMYMWKSYGYNKQSIKCLEEETVKESMDEEVAGDEDLYKALNDPNISEEDKNMLRRQMKQQAIQPLPFSKFNSPFKVGLEEEKWWGLRAILDWNPNQINKLEYTLLLDNRKINFRNYKLNVMSILPFSDNSPQGAFLIGRKEGDQSLALQCHLNLSESSKILLISSHQKPDMNQGVYIFEYNHDFERFNTSVKVSNMESSLSASAPVFKNVFVGFEAVKHPKSPSFLYNYGFCLKPSNLTKGFGMSLSYMSAYPAVSFDASYNITRNWTSYLSLSKNWHPMAAMSGAASEYKMFNLEFNPLASRSAKNKNVLRSFGVGFKFTSNPIEEEVTSIQPQDDFEEFEFDRISTQHIK